MMKTLLEKLFKDELNDLLTEKKTEAAKPIIVFHGTSSKFLPKIFQLGVIPNSKQGAWRAEDDKHEVDADIRNPSLRSLEGSYWTTRVGTASSSATAAVMAYGGDKMYIIAQIVPRTALADEDNIRSLVKRAFDNMMSNWFGGRKNSESEVDAWKLKGAIDADPAEYQKMVDDFSVILYDLLIGKNGQGKVATTPFDKSLFKETFDTYFERILGHADIGEYASYKRKYLDNYELYLPSGTENVDDLVQDKHLNPPKLNKVQGEKNYLNTLDKLTKKYKKTVKPSEQAFDTTLRVTTPIGFSGKNKILAIVTEKEVPKTFNSALTIEYGNLPNEFINLYDDWETGPYTIFDKKTNSFIKENTTNVTPRFVNEKLTLSKYRNFCELVADEYDKLPDYDPEALSSYKALISHIEKMYQRMLSKVKVVFVEGEPYSNQKAMADDVKKTGVLKISKDFNDHDVFSPEQNLKFRAVHDYIVHILSNVDFTDKGEVAAFNAHSKLLPPKAIPAAFTEIVGQACYANVRGSFPKQKIAIMKNFDFNKVGNVKGFKVDQKKNLVKDDESTTATAEVQQTV